MATKTASAPPITGRALAWNRVRQKLACRNEEMVRERRSSTEVAGRTVRIECFLLRVVAALELLDLDD